MQVPQQSTVVPFSDRSRRDVPVPPQALEVEEAVLAGLMIDSHALERILGILKPEHFYLSAHADIYRAILSLREQGDPVDMLTVCKCLHSRGHLEKVGGQNRIAEIVEPCLSAVNIDSYAKLLIEKFNRRQIIQLAQDLQRRAQDESEPLPEVQDWAESQIFALSESATQKGLRPLIEIVDDELVRMKDPGSEGLKSGFYDLDFFTKGFKTHQLITIAGRPGSGKSSFAAAMLRSIASQGTPVALFSLEMSGGEVGRRLISCESLVDSRHLESGALSDQQWESVLAARERLNIPLEIDESRNVTPGHVLTESRRLKSKHGGRLGLIVVDYLHLMLDEEDEVKQLGKLTRFFKKMTRELECPIVVLSQLNRAVEARSDKRPMMSDLRQSGRIEEDSDIVILLYRDEYYNPQTEDKGIAEVIIAKNRSGPTGVVKLLFQPEFSTFRNLGGGVSQVYEPPTPKPRPLPVQSNPVSVPVPVTPVVVQNSAESVMDNQRTYYLNRQYRISMEAMGKAAAKDCRKTPNFESLIGVGKIVTLMSWEQDELGIRAMVAHADGSTQTLSLIFLVEVEP